MQDESGFETNSAQPQHPVSAPPGPPAEQGTPQSGPTQADAPAMQQPPAWSSGESAQPTRVLPQVPAPEAQPGAQPHYEGAAAQAHPQPAGVQQPWAGQPSQPTQDAQIPPYGEPSPPTQQPLAQPPSGQQIPYYQPGGVTQQPYAPQPPSSQAYGQPPVPPTYYGPAPAPPASGSGKKWIAIAVALLLVLVVGGVAGAFVLRGGDKPAGSSEAAPSRGEKAPGEATAGGLRISFKSDDIRYYDMEFTMDGTMTGSGALADDSGSLPMSIKLTASMTLQVLERLPDGSTRLRMSMSNMKMSMKMAGESFDVPGDELDQIDMTLLVNPDGTFQFENAPGTGFAIPGGGGVFGPAGGSTVSPFGFTAPTPFLPDRQIRVGDTWEKTVEVKVPGFKKPLQVSTKNKYERDEETTWGKAMVLLSRSSTTIDFSELDTTELGAQFGIVTKGTMTATTESRFWFVPELGEAVKQELDPSSSVKGTMEMSQSSGSQGRMPGSGGETMSIEMDMRLGMTLERKSAPPPGAGRPPSPGFSS